MAESSKDRTRTPSLKTKLVRSQKILQLTPSETRPPDIPEDSEVTTHQTAPRRTLTPGDLSTKGHDRRRRGTEIGVRQRSQSLLTKESPSTPSPRPSISKSHSSYQDGVDSPKPGTKPLSTSTVSSSTSKPERSSLNIRSASAIASQTTTAVFSPTPSQTSPGTTRLSQAGHLAFPPLPTPKDAPDVQPAPASGMYWSLAPLSGNPRSPLRAHTSTLVGSNIYIFGGCNLRTCFNEINVLDADAFYLSTPHVAGDIPPPLRAMTCTAVGRKLVVFGGGDGPVYYNNVFVLDTQNFRWSKPRIASENMPSKRRAHTACLYKNGIYVFGGGDGVRALNDVWRLDVSDMRNMSWKLISPATSGGSSDSGDSSSDVTSIGDKEKIPEARGYHTANMVGSKLIIFGGSDGGECFRDVWIFDVETLAFSSVHIPVSYPRLSHTATSVGSYLFIIGGHNGVEYTNDVLLLNLVTMHWDRRQVYGKPLKARGYHGAVLHDSRLIVTGGFDGGEVFGDVWVLELAVHAYYSQISHFSIDV